MFNLIIFKVIILCLIKDLIKYNLNSLSLTILEHFPILIPNFAKVWNLVIFNYINYYS